MNDGQSVEAETAGSACETEDVKFDTSGVLADENSNATSKMSIEKKEKCEVLDSESSVISEIGSAKLSLTSKGHSGTAFQDDGVNNAKLEYESVVSETRSLGRADSYSEDSNMSVTSSTMTSHSTPVKSSGTHVSSGRSKPNGSLNSTVKKTRRRGTAWSDDETEYLLEIWARQVEVAKDQGGEEGVTCAAVYRFISREMIKKNYDKTWEQCKTRIHTLKRAYKITKDEISSGATTITYCRHFDKLRIICGDNPEISPGILAATLEEKRLIVEAENKPRVRLPVKRKLPVGEPPSTVKKPTVAQSSPLPSFSTFSQTSMSSAASSSTSWYPAQPSKNTDSQSQQNMSVLQRSLSTPVNPAPGYQQHAVSSHTAYPYNPQESGSQTSMKGYQGNQEINNNQVHIKPEKVDPTFQSQNAQVNVSPSTQWNSFTPVTNVQNLSQGQDDLERLRLDLEMKRLEVERNKLEMEERQRREERDHQFRMMQLLLIGLGQQNVNAQGIEVTHAHSTDLSRALESGLVPGGQQTVNEKGLSFSEI